MTVKTLVAVSVIIVSQHRASRLLLLQRFPHQAPKWRILHDCPLISPEFGLPGMGGKDYAVGQMMSSCLVLQSKHDYIVLNCVKECKVKYILFESLDMGQASESLPDRAK